ncbi:hypothetical protein P691DRAFT_612324, partial [Macrolepiota fuliginosa MF-IS2]
PPPTTNTLDPAQRKRLLKSTQKLGALLGTTPRVFEPGTVLPPPLTPATRAFRREGKVFHNQSASSSTTSLSSLEHESYVWVPSPTEMLMKHHKNASTPITIEFPLSGSGKAISSMAEHKRSRSSQQHSATVPQQLSQPLLYRLRSVPIPPPTISPAFTREKTLPQILPLSPISPISPIFDAPAKVSTKPRGQKELSESDRRRKMAKLARTLGENIPQELVFGPPPRSSSLFGNTMATVTTTANTPAPLPISRRKRSATGVHRPPTLTSPPKSQSPNDNIPPIPVQPVGKKSIPRKASKTSRKEREWSGEWNVKDMEDVVKALRGLR